MRRRYKVSSGYGVVHLDFEMWTIGTGSVTLLSSSIGEKSLTTSPSLGQVNRKSFPQASSFSQFRGRWSIVQWIIAGAWLSWQFARVRSAISILSSHVSGSSKYLSHVWVWKENANNAFRNWTPILV